MLVKSLRTFYRENYEDKSSNFEERFTKEVNVLVAYFPTLGRKNRKHLLIQIHKLIIKKSLNDYSAGKH